MLPNWRREEDSWHSACGLLVRLKYSTRLPCQYALGWTVGMAVYVSRGVKADQRDDSGVVDCFAKCTRYRFDRRLLIAMCLLGAAAFAPSEALALCAPSSASSNVTVTCSGATLNQGTEANTGYGSGLQNGLTLNVQSGASVTGTSTGIDVGSNNKITNLGTVTTLGSGGIGDVWGINSNGTNLTVINSGTIGRLDIPNFVFDLAGINASDTGLSVTNKVGATIQGSFGIQGIGTGKVINSGLITGLTTSEAARESISPATIPAW